MNPIESSGTMDGWPENEPSKPTQTAVFGINYVGGALELDVLWTGRFPHLEPAMYWSAKKEVEAVRKHQYGVASRVLWQHDITPEQAVAESFNLMKPQLLRSFAAADVGFDPAAALFSDPAGPMKPIHHAKGDQTGTEADRRQGPPGGTDPAPSGPRRR